MDIRPLENLDDLVGRLILNPRVIGIVRYGRRRADEMEPGGDFDLLVIVTERPRDVESIHFDVGAIPVDLSVRTVDDLRRAAPLSAMVDPLLPTSEILFDRTGALQPEIAALPARWSPEVLPLARLTEAEAARRRFGHRHALDKARHRLASEPLLCHVLLSTNIYWLLQTYMATRRLPYEGEKAALTWLESHDPQVYEAIERFFATQDLAEKLSVSEWLAEGALAPIGGPWRRGEVLVLAANEAASHLQAQGPPLFAELFDAASGGAVPPV